MGRVKLQIKKIENTTNRQVTFSKRRNGLIKKAYELSVLCDVDVALVMFSPSGRASVFSGNKSVEEILMRYVNLPEHERGRLHNQEHLQRALGKLKTEVDQTQQASSPEVVPDSQLEELQQEIVRFKFQMEEMEKQIRIYESNLSDFTTLSEAEQQEKILEESLERVRMRKQVLQENYKCTSTFAAPVQVHLPPETPTQLHGFVSENSSNILADWLPPQRDPQILNFVDSNGLLPIRDESQRVAEMLPSPATLVHGQNMNNIDDHIATPCGLEDDNNIVERVHHQFGQAIHANLSPWNHFYQTDNSPIAAAQPRERALLELYLSQLHHQTS